VAFWYERGKTGAPSRSHLTHEAIEALRDWLRVASKGRYVFSGRNGNPLKVGSLNKWLKSLARRAKIEKRGKIRFHLLRKFTLSQLSASGMNQWEAKLCTGKMIPSDILTYLKDQTENLRKKFMLAESRLTLTGLTNSHYGKIGEISTKMKELKSILTKQQKEMREQTLKIDVLTDSLTKQEQINRNFTDLFNGLIEEGLRPKIEKVSRKKGIEIFGELKNLHAKTVKLIEGKPEKRKEGHYQY